MARPKTKARILPCGRPVPPAPPPPDEATLEVWKQRLRDYLSGKGLKWTDQRWTIANLILTTGGHLDAQDIVARVKAVEPGIGAATVYRNIKVLCEAGLLEDSHRSQDGRTLYELPDEHHHDHIVCQDCNEIFEFHDDAIENLQEKIAKDFGFRLEGHRHLIQGRCIYLKK
jgi:Fur family ferric uptake transcriptional regulator